MIRRPPTALSLTKQDVEEMRKTMKEQATKHSDGEERGRETRAPPQPTHASTPHTRHASASRD